MRLVNLIGSLLYRWLARCHSAHEREQFLRMMERRYESPDRYRRDIGVYWDPMEPRDWPASWSAHLALLDRAKDAAIKAGVPEFSVHLFASEHERIA
jgi:hypothetical protein